jgi:shikimate kinase
VNSSDANPANLVLVGFMGTGKSAVGRTLAARLRRRFLDTDSWIRRRAGKSIPEIFRREGEAAFRELEAAAVEHVAGLRRTVVSTGGGILVRPGNLERLRASGILICLTSRPEVILARTAPWRGRPLLQAAADPRGAVERLMEERQALYARADWSVDSSDLRVDEVVDRICSELPSLFTIAATRSPWVPESSSA